MSFRWLPRIAMYLAIPVAFLWGYAKLECGDDSFVRVDPLQESFLVVIQLARSGELIEKNYRDVADGCLRSNECRIFRAEVDLSTPLSLPKGVEVEKSADGSVAIIIGNVPDRYRYRVSPQGAPYGFEKAWCSPEGAMMSFLAGIAFVLIAIVARPFLSKLRPKP